MRSHRCLASIFIPLSEARATRHSSVNLSLAPMIFSGIYGNDSTPLYFQLFFFTLYIMSASVVMTYLRYKTNSIWTAVTFHMSGNVFIQKVFTPLTEVTEGSGWYIDEFGAIPALVAFLVAVYFWVKGKNEFGQIYI